MAGLISDEASGGRNIYMKEPTREPVWAIGIYKGESPFSLAAPEYVDNPVLTYAQVTDVPASYVADPFMLRVDGTWHMFFEVLNWRTKMGEVGLAGSEVGARWT